MKTAVTQTGQAQTLEELVKKWQAATDEVIRNNHEKNNLFATATLFVESVFNLDNVAISKKERGSLISRIVRSLQQEPLPLSSPQTLTTLETLAYMAPVRMLSVLDAGYSIHHTLPRSLFSESLPNSYDSWHQLKHSGVLELQSRLGEERLRIDSYYNVWTELPRIAAELRHFGCRTLYVVDNSVKNLEMADRLLEPVANMPVYLVLIKKKRHGESFLPVLLSPSLIHYYQVIDHFDELPRLMSEQVLNLQAAVVCSFDGTVIDKEAMQTQQGVLASKLVLELLKAKDRVYLHSDKRSKPFFAPM